MYWIIFGVALLASWIVGARFKSKFKKYGKMPLSVGLTGFQVAQRMLRENGIHDVEVISVQGSLTDHYNPTDKTVNLSPEVYHGNTIAAAAVAAHECGHAIQHARAYSMLQFRTTLVPLQNISSKLINIIFFVGLIGAFAFQLFPIEAVIFVIVLAYFFITLFAFVTLPVEFDASKRALAWLDQTNITDAREHKGAKDALNWAAMTYVVSALSSLAFLLYYASMLYSD